MLEQKRGQFWNLHRIPNKTSNPDFRFFFQVFSGLKKVIVISIRKSSLIKKTKKKVENRKSGFEVLCEI